jgi:predicted phosphodiesterase
MWESNCHVSAHANDFGSAEAEPTSLRHRLVSVHTKQIDDDHYVHRVIVPVSSKGIEAAPVRSTLGAEAESIGRPVDSSAIAELAETKAPVVSDFFAPSDADGKKEVEKVQSEAEGHYFFYQVVSGATASRVYRARIPSAKQADIAIAFIGDTQYGARTFRHHLWHLSLQKPELLVHVGDMVHDGLSIKEWRTYWTGPLEQAALGSSLPLLTVRGNHDGESPLAFAYLHSNPGGWFAYNAGLIRFVVLNTNLPISADDVQTKWLESELQSEASRTATYLIVLMHVPAFVDFWDTAAWSHGDSKPTAAVRRFWVPLFERNHVSMVISGHSHVYQRGSLNGVVYTIVGGGGGALDVDRVADTIYSKTSHTHHHAMLRASHAQLEWVVHDIGESEIDRVTIDAMQRGRA